MYSRLLLPASVVLPISLFAQDSTSRADSTPFHRGQWAAQFQTGFEFGSLGLLKFRSPSRAMVLDARLSGAHAETIVRDTAGSRFVGFTSSASFELRFGWRRYRADGGSARLASHYTLGALLGLDHAASGGPGGGGEDNRWSAGVFGDVGGTYLVTQRFGLGALGSISLTYSTTIPNQRPSTPRVRSWRIAGSAASGSLVATLFF